MTVPAVSDLEESVRSLAPLIREHADASERARRVAPAVIDALREANVFDLMVPRPLGGLEADPATLVRVIEEVSIVDGSAGWIVMIGATTGVIAAYLDDDVGRAIYGQRGVVTGGVVAPRGRADVVKGGYRVSGRWPFASGCEHSQWLLGGALIFEDGELARLPDGQPDWRQMIVPAADMQIIDTWSVSGLRATGSHDIALKDAAVPREYSVSFATDPLRHEGPLYRLPVFGLFGAAVCAVTLGIARGAIDEIVELAARKTPTGATKPVRERGVAQQQIAEAEASLRAGRAFLFEALGEAWETVCRGDGLEARQRALLRLAAAHGAACAARAVDIAYNLGGASSIYESNPLQRRMRDVHVATQHIMVAPANFETAGRVLFGLEAGPNAL